MGNCWVWVAFDPESKAILGFVLGKRTKQHAVQPLEEVSEILGKAHFPIFTSDEFAAYEDTLIQVFGVTVQPERQVTRGRFPKPKRVPHPELDYALVHKERKENRVVKVERRAKIGDSKRVEKRLKASAFSNRVNTSGVERQNEKLRVGSARLERKSLAFSKNKNLTCYGAQWPLRMILIVGHTKGFGSGVGADRRIPVVGGIRRVR